MICSINYIFGKSSFLGELIWLSTTSVGLRTTGSSATAGFRAVGWSTFVSVGALVAEKSRPDRRSRFDDFIVALGSRTTG